MEEKKALGYIHSFQSLGTADGPGVRAVVFMQGCPLRCACCHNPDTWETSVGEKVSAEEIFKKVCRYKAYFSKKGGITVSGGEPLLQQSFVTSLFELCKSEGIHTALDTSGCILNKETERLLELCDLVLLDYKYTNENDYLKYTGMSLKQVDLFLDFLEGLKKPTVIRQVIIPKINDNKDSISRLFSLAEDHCCIEKIEMLPFRKLCVEKYRALGIPFRFENIEECPSDFCISREYREEKK